MIKIRMDLLKIADIEVLYFAAKVSSKIMLKSLLLRFDNYLFYSVRILFFLISYIYNLIKFILLKK